MSISFINIGAASNTSGVSTEPITYAPAAGNTVVVIVNFGGAVTGLTITDNLGNSLTQAATIGASYIFYQSPVPFGVTGYTANWTTARQVSLLVGEYAGVFNVNISLSPNTNSGTSGTATLTSTTTVNNGWMVVALGNSASDTLAGSVGNARGHNTTSTARSILMDTTAAAPSSLTCSATMTSGAWRAVALELQPYQPAVFVPPTISAEYVWGGGDGW